MNGYFACPRTIKRLCQGPLCEHIGPYSALLRECGYSKASAQSQIVLISDFSLWLERNGIRLAALNEKTLQRYQRHARGGKGLRRGDVAALHRLLVLLRRMEVVQPKRKLVKVNCRARTIAEFGCYLAQQRRLSEATLKNYLPFINRFLVDRFRNKRIDLSHIQASDVIGFVQRQAHTLIPKRMKTLVTALRSFLRYLQHQGRIAADLAAGVPTVPAWSLTTLPKFL